MGNNELLLAISDMMDKKIESIISRIDAMENRLCAKMQAFCDKSILEENHRADIKATDSLIAVTEAKFSVDIREIDIVTEKVLSIPVNYSEKLQKL